LTGFWAPTGIMESPVPSRYMARSDVDRSAACSNQYEPAA
jgi:hypothetical protein